MNDATLDLLRARLGASQVKQPLVEVTDPPKGAVWTTPELVAEIRYTEVSNAGYLRQPVFIRLRDDVAVDACEAPPEVARRLRCAGSAGEGREARAASGPRAQAPAHPARQGVLAGRGLHQGGPARLLRGGLAVARAVPARPAARADPLSRRDRGEVLLPEERARLHARVGDPRERRGHRLLRLQRAAHLAVRDQLGRDPAARVERAPPGARPAGLADPRPRPEAGAVRARGEDRAPHPRAARRARTRRTSSRPRGRTACT